MADRPTRPHLLCVNHFAVTPGEGGTTRHFELGRELVRDGWRVTLCASDFTYQQRRYTRRQDPRDRDPIAETLEHVGLVWLWAAAYDGNDLRRIWNWLSFGRSLLRWGRDAERGEVERGEVERRDAERPDVVVGSSPSLFAALAAHRLARRWRVPFVLEVRDIWPESLLAVGARRGPGYLALRTIARYLYRRADRIVVLARGTADHLRRLGVPESRLAFVPNGVDTAAFDGIERPARDTFTVAYAGAHGPANGLDVVLDAAERLKDQQFPRTAPESSPDQQFPRTAPESAPDQQFPRTAPESIRFLLVGDGPAKAELMASAGRRGLDNVEFHDPVPKAAIPEILAGADAGLMVLRDAALFAYGVSPNKLFDYFAAGLPVVCNVPGDVAGMVESAGAGEQAVPGSADALAEAIFRLSERTPEERRAMGRAGREWVVRERSRPVLARRLEEALRPLVPG